MNNSERVHSIDLIYSEVKKLDKIEIVRAYVDNIIKNILSEDDRKTAYIHTYGVAEACSFIADKRRLNTELSYISGLLHDIYYYKTGICFSHAHNGAEMARVALLKMDVFSDDEKVLILSAIYHHSDITHVHDEYDEVLKDADILQSFLYDPSFKISYRSIPRLNHMLNEFNIKAVPIEYGYSPSEHAQLQNKRMLLANIAEELAAKRIVGEETDKVFLEIIKYYPEASALKELKNAWCAAFVYHCCLKAGFQLPLKPTPATFRLAGVGAWYEWSKHNNFCFYEKDSFVPVRGDIVIYNNIISVENKPQNSPWHDHIGVVLSCEGEQISVAEGNIDNNNFSGIVTRMRDITIGCYVRIPNDYVYDGWKYDYKTGEILNVDYKSNL